LFVIGVARANNKRTSNVQLRSVLHFYKPIGKEAEARIWALQKTVDHSPMPEDERLEDAGLSDTQEEELIESGSREQTKVAIAWSNLVHAV
jgi:hypothetical protein